MPTPALSREKHTEIHRLKGLGWKNVAIAAEIGVGVGTVSNYSHIPVPEPNEHRKHDRIEEFSEFHREKFLELQARYRKWVGDTGDVKTPKRKPGKRIKALAINDVHAPFHNEEKLAEALRRHKDADECWVVGDLLDLFGVSRYPKSRQDFALVEEFQSGQAIMRLLSETFPVVRVLHGNHDERWIKYLVAKNIPPDVLEFMRYAYPNVTSPLAKIASCFPNVQMMEPKRLDYAEYGYLYQIGDCVLSHAERYSKIPNKAVTDVIDAFMKKLRPMGVLDDFKVVGQAHTHGAGKTWNDYGVIGIEMGCLSRIPDYDGNARINGRAPVTGCTVFYQENGVTDRNASNFIEL
jgi:hypothetical protein